MIQIKAWTLIFSIISFLGFFHTIFFSEWDGPEKFRDFSGLTSFGIFLEISKPKPIS